MSDDQIPLHPMVASIQASFRADGDQQFGLADDDFARTCEAMLHVPAAERHDVGLHLGAVIAKCQRVAPANTRLAVSQLVILLTVLFGSTDAARAAVEQAGGQLTSELANTIGAVQSKIPVGANRAAGSVSPLLQQLRNMKRD